MRVLNTLEREVIDVGYGTWLRDETKKCNQVGTMLRAAGHETQAESLEDVDREESMRGLEGWYDEYCGSCRQEQARIGSLGSDYMAAGR